jgi:hypothetical protein
MGEGPFAAEGDLAPDILVMFLGGGQSSLQTL